jgi:hypothetical protein
MKLLLDEKWNGIKNGVLLAQAAAEGFEALITTDRNIEFQQNAAALPCAIVIMDVNSSDIDELRRLIPGLLRALASLQPRTIVHVA